MCVEVTKTKEDVETDCAIVKIEPKERVVFGDIYREAFVTPFSVDEFHRLKDKHYNKIERIVRQKNKPCTYLSGNRDNPHSCNKTQNASRT